MYLSVKEWIEKVKTNMEELTPGFEDDVLQVGGLSIDKYISMKLPEAIASVLSIAPVYMTEAIDIRSVLKPVKNEDGSGRVFLPEDLLRMISFKMKGWSRPVTHFIDTQHPLYAFQNNQHMRGNCLKPVCVLTVADDGCAALDYYSLPSAVKVHEIESALYVPFPAEKEGGFDIHVRLIPSVSYTCAAIIYEIMGRSDMATVMNQRI